MIDWMLIGSISSIVGVGVTIFLTGFVVWSDKNRRNKEDEFYKSYTELFMHKIFSYFTKIDELSRIEDLDEDHDEAVTRILRQLGQYYKQNHKEMEDTLKDSQMFLHHWRGINVDARNKYHGIIVEFEWLINEYFCSNESRIAQHARWDNYHDQLSDKRYKIEDELAV